MQSVRECPACGSANAATAECCAVCGAELIVVVEPVPARPADNDPALEFVDPENRFELERYETDTGAEAEIDCGLLRANGIACELGSPALPGLPSDRILWVNKQDANAARALLDEVETSESEEDE